MLDQFLSDPSKIGAMGLMAIAIASLMRGWVITSSHHSAIVSLYEIRMADLVKEKNEFKDMIIHSVGLTDRALQVAQSQIGPNNDPH